MKDATTNRWSFFLLLVTISLAPLPFGSTDPLATALWALLLGLAFIFLRPNVVRSGYLALLGLAAANVIGYGFVLHEQLAERPWLGISLFHPLWQQSSVLLNTPLTPSVSIARDQPLLALGPSLCCALAMICSFVICSDRHRSRQLLKAVAWSGAIYAALGIVSFMVDPSKVLWRDKQAYTTVLTATFINRNTAAVYFGACALIWQLFICEKISSRIPGVANRNRTWLLEIFLSGSHKITIAAGMLLLCITAMFLTGSRAGVVCSLGVLVLAPVLFFRRQLPRKSGLVLAFAYGLIAALILLETLGAGVNSRFDLDQLADGGRMEAYRSTWRMIADHPWLGTGLGTFAWNFPAYRSDAVSIWGIWDRAHNTPLELAAELGLPLLFLVVLSWLIALAVLANGVRIRERDLIVPLSGLMIGLLGLVHSMIDFSLQIPGFAIVVFAVVGAGLAQSFRSQRQPAPDDLMLERRIGLKR